jgi:ABC-2 type transport system permease protein
MSRTRHLIKKEFLQIRRDRPMMALLFVVPIIQLLFLGYAVSADVRGVKLAVCDRDGSELSRSVVDRFRNNDTFRMTVEIADEAETSRALDSGRAQVALIIPAGFAADAAAGIPTAMQILLDGQDSNTSTVALGYAMGILEETVSDLSRAAGSSARRTLTPDIRIQYNEDLKMTHYMIPGIIVFLLLMVTSLVSAMGLVREKEIGTFEQLLVSPLKKHEILIGKIVPYSVIGFIELILAVGFARLWYGIPIVGNLAWFGFNIAIFLFTTLGIGLLVSATASTQQQAMFLTVFSMFFFLIMSGFMFPIENMPTVMRLVSYLDPMRYMLAVTRGVFIKGSGPRELYPQTLALALFGAVIFSSAVWRFQKKIR